VANTLQKSTRLTDHHARIGGEEMAIVLLGAHAAIGRNIAEKARLQIVNVGLTYNGVAVPLTASFGGATLEPTAPLAATGIPPEVIAGRMMQAADSALYAAKQSGRNRVCWSSDSGLPTKT
jgi:diguanylate cyclase (GGDEF)-like protein